MKTTTSKIKTIMFFKTKTLGCPFFITIITVFFFTITTISAEDITTTNINFESLSNDSQNIAENDTGILGNSSLKSTWDQTLKPYPEPQPYSKNAQFFEYLNTAKLDMVADVKFDTSTSVDFGLFTGFSGDHSPGQLIGKRNPSLSSLSLTRNACPFTFSKYWLRKVNQLRGRHQAPPLVITTALSGNATHLAARLNAQQIDQSYFSKPGIAYWEHQTVGPSVEHVQLSPEQFVQTLYMKGAANYTFYGKEPTRDQLRLNSFHTFIDLVYTAAEQAGLGCLTTQTGVYDSLYRNIRSVETRIQIVVLYEHWILSPDVVHYKENVFPPGYYQWGRNVKPNADDDDDANGDFEGNF